MFKAALLSGWHVHAEGYAKEFNRVPGCRIAAVWDEDRARGEALAKALDCGFYGTAEAALRAPGVTAGILCSPTTSHPELLKVMAGLGRHVFTEKVLCVDTADAKAAADAIRSAGVQFAISFPHLGNPGVKAARQIMLEGRLGSVGCARVRNVHDGAVAGWLPPHFYDERECGGGAMIDLGAHPMYTLASLLGTPETVTSLFTSVTGKPVEDNAVSLLRFPGGVIGVSETGFLSRGNPYTLEISGSKGSLMLHETLRVCDETTGMKWAEVKDLPPASPSPLQQWAQACLGGGSIPEELGLDAAVRLTALMEAAYLSHRSGRAADVIL